MHPVTKIQARDYALIMERVSDEIWQRAVAERRQREHKQGVTDQMRGRVEADIASTTEATKKRFW